MAASNAQALLSVMWRASARLALIAEYRGVGVVSGSISSTARVDDHTSVDVVGSGDVDFEGGGAIGARAHWSWDDFNLRVGVSFGNYNIGGVNLVVPTRTIVPEVDLFWRL